MKQIQWLVFSPLNGIQRFDTCFGDVPTGFLVSNPGLGATKLQRVLILWCIVHPSRELERTQRPRPR